MDVICLRYRQYRTLTATYCFKIAADKIVLKIYDISERCLCKVRTSAFDPVAVRHTLQGHPSSFLSALVEKDLLPQTFAIPTFETSSSDMKRCQESLTQAVADIKSHMITDHDSSKQFTCPITMAVFKEPIICSCGHTFEKEAIERATKDVKVCPLDRLPITSMAPNFSVKSALESWQKEDPIPTFSSFQKNNKALAQAHLSTARALVEEGETSQAIDSYKKAFQYTKDEKEYVAIPELYRSLQEPEKERLAHLYFASYLMEAEDIPAAIKSLEHAKALEVNLSPSLPINFALIMLYRLASHDQRKIKELIQETTLLLQTAPPERAIPLAQEILSQDFTNYPLYEYLAALLKNEDERRQLLLKGTLHALDEQKFLEAESLCTKTTPKIFEDALVFFQMRASRDKRTITLLEEVAGQFFSEKKFKPARQAFKTLLLTQENPVYYERVIDSYFAEQKLTKVFSKAIKLIELYVEQSSYPQAEQTSLKALEATKRIDERITLYRKLEIVYLKTDSPKLEDLWTQLGASYEEIQDLDHAQQIYAKAQERFEAPLMSFKLAHLLAQKGQLQESVLVYYAQAEKAILRQDRDALECCYQEILAVDPRLRFLDGLQKIHLLSQRQILQLTHELKDVKAQLTNAHKRLDTAEAKIDKQEQIIEGMKFFFGRHKWLQYFGDIGAEPPLPPDIHAILAAPCPFFPGKIVQETHRLVLIPNTVNGRPFTLNTLGELVQHPQQGQATKYDPGSWKKAFEVLGNVPVTNSYWVLMTKDVLPGSRSKSYADQRQLVESHRQRTKLPYEVPHTLEAATVMFLEYVQTGVYIYPREPWTFTRCQEKIDGYQMVVGGFAGAGLSVSDDCSAVGYESRGVGPLRKF